MTISNTVQVALFLALVVKTLTDYLKAPLINTPVILKWMILHHWAYIRDDASDTSGPRFSIADGVSRPGDRVVIWCIPYVTFVMGLVLSIITKTDIVQPIFQHVNVPEVIRFVITGLIIGGGSNIIHELMPRR